MNGDDRRSMEEQFRRAFKPLDDLITKLTSADGTLAGVRSDVEVIKNEQEHQGRDIEAIHLDVRGIHGTIDRMRSDFPKRWNEDIDTKVESRLAQRDEITAVQNLAREREQAARDATRPRTSGFFREAFRGTGKLIVYLAVAIGLGLGAAVVMRCSDGNHLEQKIEDLQAEIEKMNGNG